MTSKGKEIADKEQAIIDERRAGELDVQDAANYWGGYKTPTPTKRDVALAKGKTYSVSEKEKLFDLILKHKGIIDDVVEAVAKGRAADKNYPVRLIDRPRLYTFLNNHIGEFYKAARTAYAIPAILKLCESADQDSIKFAAAREFMNRADGMPTQHLEVEAHILDWAELKKRRDEGAKEYASGEWYNKDDEPLDKPEESEYDER